MLGHIWLAAALPGAATVAIRPGAVVTESYAPNGRGLPRYAPFLAAAAWLPFHSSIDLRDERWSAAGGLVASCCSPRLGHPQLGGWRSSAAIYATAPFSRARNLAATGRPRALLCGWASAPS
jgi:hypothetical protein